MMITVHYANIQHVFQSDIYTCSGRHRGIYWSKASLGTCLEWYYNLTWSLHLLQNWLSVILRNNHIWSKMTLYWVNSDILKCIVSDIITLREIKWVYKGFPLLQSDPWDLYSGVITGLVLIGRGTGDFGSWCIFFVHLGADRHRDMAPIDRPRHRGFFLHWKLLFCYCGTEIYNLLIGRGAGDFGW